MAMLTQTFSPSSGGIGTQRGLRDPSFSSYLNGDEKSFVLNLAKQYCKANDDADDDGEIGVFSADKYFNESLDEEKPIPVSVRLVPSVENQNPLQHKSRAMSVRSGSSGNSQSALLNGASKVRVRGGGGYLGRSFRCRCVCSDKNSVEVEEYESYGEGLTLSQRATEEPVKKAAISPVKCLSGQRLKRETYLISKDLPVNELPRKSLDVFGLPFIMETEKKVKLKWEDMFPKPVQTVIPTTVHAVDDESDSDASSDLFEIEEFTGKVNSFLSRQTSRNMCGSATPPAGYAPSEASIAWSVVTASAAEFPITSNSKPGCSTVMSKKVAAVGDKPRRVSSSFMTCNSQASVKVDDHAHKTHEKVSDRKIITNQVTKPQT